MSGFDVGDPVVYRMPKHSSRPGPRAKSVQPASRGEDYAYVVDKYWVVAGRGADGSVEIMTRTGKRRTVAPGDPRLRKATIAERLLLRSRFPSVTGARQP